MEKIPMTREGFVALESELKHLKSKERPEIIKAIAEARAHGDLKENAEYHAAKEKQSFNEGRILELDQDSRRSNFTTGVAQAFGLIPSQFLQDRAEGVTVPHTR